MMSQNIIKEIGNANSQDIMDNIKSIVDAANINVRIKFLPYIPPELKDEKLLNKLLELNYSIKDIIEDESFLKLITANNQTVFEFAVSQQDQYPSFITLSLLDDAEKTIEICAKRCIDLANHKFRTKEIGCLPINDVGLKILAFCLRLQCANNDKDNLYSGHYLFVPPDLNKQELYNEVISMNECPDYMPEEYHTDEIIKCAFTDKNILNNFPNHGKTFGVCFYAYNLDPENVTIPYNVNTKMASDIKKYKDIIKSITPATIEIEYQKIQADSQKYELLISSYPSSMPKLRELFNEKPYLFDIYDFIGKTMTGADFNFFMKDKTIIKLFAGSKIHNRMEFVVGLNVDPVKFNPNARCCEGGIYFIEKKNNKVWREYNYTTMEYFSLVIIPDDAYVYIEDDKFKADKLHIVAFRSLSIIDTVSFALDA